jgi:hypothetical protein
MSKLIGSRFRPALASLRAVGTASRKPACKLYRLEAASESAMGCRYDIISTFYELGLPSAVLDRPGLCRGVQRSKVTTDGHCLPFFTKLSDFRGCKSASGGLPQTRLPCDGTSERNLHLFINPFRSIGVRGVCQILINIGSSIHRL